MSKGRYDSVMMALVVVVSWAFPGRASILVRMYNFMGWMDGLVEKEEEEFLGS